MQLLGIIHVGRGYRKLFRVMKLTAILLLVLLQAHAHLAHGQISLEVRDKSLFDVMILLNKQTGINFSLTKATADKVKSLSFTIKDGSIKDILDRCVAGSAIRYQMVDSNEVHFYDPIKITPPDILYRDTMVDRFYKLTIMNEKGEPLSQATAVNQRTGKGTHTDVNGKAFLVVGPGDQILISFIGFERVFHKSVPAGEATVVMKPAVTTLDQVVLRAYGKTSERLQTGNIAVVRAEEIERQPVPNVIQALQGKVPGLVITQTNGNPSAPFRMELRGRSSINPNVTPEPLVIVDGVPLTILQMQERDYESGNTGFLQNNMNGPAVGQSQFYSIPPDIIESITILKDADATAIYGSRGANGVILINTKRAESGTTNLEASVSTGFSRVTRFYDMLNTQEYRALRYEALANDNMEPTVETAYDLELWDSTRNTDWQKFFWGKTAQTTNAQLSLSGGNKNTSFRLGGSYFRQTAINTSSGNDFRAGLQYNFQHWSANRKLNIGFSGMYSFVQSNMITLGNGVTLPPNAPGAFKSPGVLNYSGWEPNSQAFPFSQLLIPYTAKTEFLNNSISLSYALSDKINFSTTIGQSSNTTTQVQFTPIAAQNPRYNPTGQSLFGNNLGRRLIVEPHLTYTDFWGLGEVEVVLGGTYQTARQSGSKTFGLGYTNDLLIKSINNSISQIGTDNLGDYKYAAIFGRLNYNIQNRYILNISGRRDGSSRFGPGNRFGNFGSVGAAWILSEEKFFARYRKYVDFIKLRSSYGTTGSDNIGDYKYLTRWMATIPYSNTISYFPGQHANPNLQWQSDKKFEVGLNVQTVKSKVDIGVSYYRNRITDQLITFALPAITGFPNITANLPATIENNGLEMTLSAKIVEQKDLSVRLSANASMNRNKLRSYPNFEKSPYQSRYEIGYPLSIVKVLSFDRVNPETGDYDFKDLNKDGQISYDYNKISADDDTYIKDLQVRIDGGFGASVNYKGWSVDMHFQYRNQNAPNAITSVGVPGQINNAPRAMQDRWRKPGDHARFAKATTLYTINHVYYSISDQIYTDASFLRLNNISLSYQLAERVNKRLRIKQSELFARGQNLWVLTSYEGIDPETHAFGGLPPLTALTAGIKVSL